MKCETKKIMSITLAVLIVLSMSACGGNDNLKNEVSQTNKVSSSTNETTTELTAVEDTTTVNFDLSQYKAHGELSYNRIWVIKEESAWDESEDFFAWFDADGNQISEWISVGDYDCFGDYDSAKVHVKYEFDGKNPYLILTNHTPRNPYSIYVDTITVSIFDVDFNLLHSETLARIALGRMEYEYSKPEPGLLFFINKENELGFVDIYGARKTVYINWGDISKFRYVGDDVLEDLELLKINDVNGELQYYVILDYYDESEILALCILDLSGTVISKINSMSIGSAYVDLLDIDNCIKGGLIEITFRGADDKKYTAHINVNGEMVDEPVLAK